MQKSKKMGVIQLTTLTAINMMGSGIILLPANLASIGTISIFGWILAALGATLLAYAFSICGMFSRKGGGMGGYAEYRFGIRGNFVANFTYAISLVIANIAIATGVVSYMTYVFNWTLSPAGTCLVTLLVLMSAASISFFGPKAAGKFSTLGISCILTSIGGLILFGWYFFNPSIYMAAWNPSHLPFTAALRDSIAVILWAFLGLETACANSSAVENPEKNIPIAVLGGTLLAGTTYAISTAIIGGLVPYQELMVSHAPFGIAYSKMFGPVAGTVVSFLLVCSCYVSLTAWQFTISEVVRSSAVIGHFPSFLKKVNRFRAPYVAILLLLLIQSALALSTMSPTLLKQFNVLINLAVVINLVPYVLSMTSIRSLLREEGITGNRAQTAYIAAFAGTIYSLYAIYGCGWTIISYGVLCTILGYLISVAKYRHPKVQLAHK